ENDRCGSEPLGGFIYCDRGRLRRRQHSVTSLEAPGHAIVKIEESSGSSEKLKCVFDEPTGTVETNTLQTVTVGLAKTGFTAKNGGEPTPQERFRKLTMGAFLGVIWAFESASPYAKVRVESNCVYSVKSMGEGFALPGMTEGPVHGTGELSNAGEGC